MNDGEPKLATNLTYMYNVHLEIHAKQITLHFGRPPCHESPQHPRNAWFPHLFTFISTLSSRFRKSFTQIFAQENREPTLKNALRDAETLSEEQAARAAILEQKCIKLARELELRDMAVAAAEAEVSTKSHLNRARHY